MKKINCLILIFSLFLIPLVAQAKSEYLYRQRANWVKITKAKGSDVPLGHLNHPYTALNSEQMEAMLLSVKISKKHIIKKEFSSDEVFNSWEARLLAQHLTNGLARADADQIVNFAIVHKRPLFVFKKDHISVGNLWVDDEGLHLQFEKLFAKLEGDYEASSQLDKSIRNAKTRRILLEAGPGQKLSYNSTMEVILDPKHPFSSAPNNSAIDLSPSTQLAASKIKKDATALEVLKPETPQSAVVQEPSPLSNRLKNLDDLKKQGLIDKKEYQTLRDKILLEL